MNTANCFYGRYLFSHRALLCLIAVWFFHGTALSADQTSSPHPEYKAEQWVIAQIAAGERANLKTEFPNEADRRLTSNFLQNLLTNPPDPLDPLQQDYKVRIGHAVLTEPVKIKLDEKTPIRYEIELIECQFEDEVNFANTTFQKRVSFIGSSFKKADFSKAKFKGVSFERSSFKSANFSKAIFEGSVNFKGVNINGNFLAQAAEFRHEEQVAVFDGMVVGDNAQFTKAIFEGEYAFFIDVKIAHNFWATEAKFTNRTGGAFFSNMQVGGEASFMDAEFSGQVLFNGADVARNFLVAGAKFTNPTGEANFVNMQVDGNANLSDAKFSGQVLFNGVDVARNFLVAGAKFTNPKSWTFFSNMQVGGIANLHGAVFFGTGALRWCGRRGGFCCHRCSLHPGGRRHWTRFQWHAGKGPGHLQRGRVQRLGEIRRGAHCPQLLGHRSQVYKPHRRSEFRQHAGGR